MLEYLVESWHYTDPQRKERSECENWESALGLARALAAMNGLFFCLSAGFAP